MYECNFLHDLLIGNFSEEEINVFFDSIQVVDPPIDFHKVNDVFSLLQFEVRKNLEYYEQAPPELFLSVESNIRISNFLKEQDFSFFSSYILSPKKKKPLWRFYKTNPIYIALWYYPDLDFSDINFNTNIHIFSHIYISTWIIRYKLINNKIEDCSFSKFKSVEHTKKVYGERIIKSLQTLRRIFIDKNGLLIDKELSCEDLVQEVKGTNNDYLSSISNVIEYADMEILPLAGRRGKVYYSKRNYTNVVVIDSVIDNELDDDSAKIKSYFSCKLSESDKKNREEIGLSYREDDSGITVETFSCHETGSINLRDSKQKTLLSRRASSHLAMKNQFLLFRRQSLTPFEVAMLLKSIFDLQEKGRKSAFYSDEYDPVEILATIYTVFLYGRDLRQLINLHYYHRGMREYSNSGIVKKGSGKYKFVALPALPARKIHGPLSFKGHTAETLSYYELDIPKAFEDILTSYIKTFLSSSDKLFFKEEKFYKDLLSSFIKKINNSYNTNINATKVSNYIFTKVIHFNNSDIVTAMHITENYNFLGVNQSYYTTIKIQRLREIYNNILEDIMKTYKSEIGLEVQINDNNSLVDYKNLTPIHVGSPLVPTKQTVKKLIKNLIAQHQSSQKGPESLKKLIKVHFHTLRYTAFLVAFSTGYRAIHAPIPFPDELDSNGFAIISDKDSEDRYKSRAVWIPPVCANQLKLFWSHQKKVAPQLKIINERFLNQPRRPSFDPLSWTVQFLGNNFDVHAVGPTTLTSNLDQIFPLPFNAARHYLRSNLLERGCPSEVIDAFMGHWERGMEPFGRFSGMSIQEYRDILINYLAPLLEEDGWITLPGWRH